MSDRILNMKRFPKANLKERACSTNVELDKAEVNFIEAFNNVQMEVLKTSSIVLFQKVSELVRCFEFLNSISMGFFKKGTKLVIPLLKMVKTGILLDSISLKLLDEVLKSLTSSMALAVTSTLPLQSACTLLVFASNLILSLSIFVACLDATMNFDVPCMYPID